MAFLSETPSTLRAAEWFFSSVNPVVLLQMASCCKALPTLKTHVIPHSIVDSLVLFQRVQPWKTFHTKSIYVASHSYEVSGVFLDLPMRENFSYTDHT